LGIFQRPLLRDFFHKKQNPGSVSLAAGVMVAGFFFDEKQTGT